MQFIHVQNFEKTQHYRYRNPPWIKQYKSLYDSQVFRALTLEHQAIYAHLQIIASRYGNQIPYDVPKLKELIGLPASKRLNLKPLIDANFIKVTNGAAEGTDGLPGTPEELFIWVVDYFRRYHSEFGWSYETPPIDPRIEKAVQAAGGWERVAALRKNEKDITFMRRDFLAYFKRRTE